MISSLIRFIDSLFYTTTIRTQTIITHTTFHTAEDGAGSPTMDDKAAEVVADDQETSVTFCDDHYRVNGLRINIPEVVRNRPPLVIEGKPNYESFPQDRYGTMLIRCFENDASFVTVNGTRLSRNKVLSGWSIENALESFTDCLTHISHDDFDSVATTAYQDLFISIAVSKDWTFVNIYNDDTKPIMHLQLLGTTQFSTNELCVTSSYAVTRAILLTLCGCEKIIDKYDERDMASMVLALVLMANARI